MIAWTREVLEECSSTQAVALERARAGARAGLVVIARRQTAGRGRRGRAWLSAEGGLALTALLRPDVDVGRLGRLSFLAAAALSDAARALGAETRFKWPNDLVVPGAPPGPLGPLRKVAGVLVELDTSPAGALESVRLGIGVNTGAAPLELPEIAASLDVDRDALLEALLARLAPALRGLDDDAAWERTLDALRARSATLGREVTLEGVRGRAVAMDGEGALVLETAEGPQRFLSGDVAVLLSSS